MFPATCSFVSSCIVRRLLAVSLSQHSAFDSYTFCSPQPRLAAEAEDSLGLLEALQAALACSIDFAPIAALDSSVFRFTNHSESSHDKLWKMFQRRTRHSCCSEKSVKEPQPLSLVKPKALSLCPPSQPFGAGGLA